MRFRVRLTAVDGTARWWHKGGQLHTLDERLGPVWVEHFRPAVFQVANDGALVPRGTPGAHDVARWELVADDGTPPLDSQTPKPT